MTRFVAILLLLLGPLSAVASPDIPPTLKEWQGWALHGAESVRCPFFAGDAAQRHCAWPGRLSLAVDPGGARFSVSVEVFAGSWVPLPGNEAHWPQDVTAGGSPLPVMRREGLPQARLEAGTHRLAGRFQWERRPESLPLGLAAGLVDVTVDGAPVVPQVDDAGRLWISRPPVRARVESVTDSVTVRVYRHLADGIPLRLSTRIELDVAGEDREIRMGRALPEGFVPVSLGGELPARLEPDGDLRLQVRAGRWTLFLEARQSSPSMSYRMETREAPWPPQELWVFAADHRLRTVTPEGAPSIDPRQTGLPPEWHALPAFVLEKDTVLKLTERTRGDAGTRPEQLGLARELWLDFDGGGFTARDRLEGTLERSGRLQFAPGVEPGRVTVNGAPQPITLLPGAEDGGAGIELRPGPVRIEAVSRVARSGALSASGVLRDVNGIGAQLHLPPGWTLFAARGVDRAAPSWVSGWTLWDIFLVLVLTVAVARLADKRVAVLMLLTLLVTHDIAGAPLFLWLNLVAVAAVWRVLPEGRLRKVVGAYRYLSVAMLAIVALVFAVQQVRQGLYPELEYPWRDIHAPVQPPAAAMEGGAIPEEAMPAAADAMAESGAPDLQALEETRAVRKMASEPLRQRVMAMKAEPAGGQAAYDRIDPGARVQTGPGVPDWQWNRVELAWEGPVAAGHAIDLWLVGPSASRALCFLRVALVGLLILALWQGRWPASRLAVRPAANTVLAIAVAAGMLLAVPTPARAAPDAAVPDAGLLAELRKRLTAPPDCLPACVAVPGLRIEAAGDRLALRLRLDAAARVAVPLPAEGSGWRPSQVLLDGRAAPVRLVDGRLAVAVEPGVHDVVLEGRPADAMTFAFPLPPGRVSVAAPGWQVGGVVDGRLAGNSLELRRGAPVTLGTAGPSGTAGSVSPDGPRKLHNDPEPPFVTVERHLRLDIDWQVETRVIRVAPGLAPLTLAIPLLDGETVNSPVTVREGRVLVALAQGQADFAWQSGLKSAPRLLLKAPETGSWVERWTLDAAMRWHVSAQGVPPVKDAGGTAWYPWPGETLQLDVVRPQAAPGDTLTLEKVRLEHSPGHRMANSLLTLSILSSEGGDWRFTLPDGAVLDRIEIDGAPQLQAGEGREVVLPLHPGEQSVVLGWRTDGEEGLVTRTPALRFDRPVGNVDVVLNVPAERWPLFTGGPGAGPAVLYWGVLLVVVLAAVALSRLPMSPLRLHEWLLLGVGMSSTMLPWTLVLVAWFFVLAARGRLDPGQPDSMRWSPGFFNFTQVVLAVFTLLALGVLFSSVPQSLVLSRPDMQIEGNGSHAGMLHWFVDRTAGEVPQGWLVSLPMWGYRLLMLAWSLWLALALVRWLKWGWQQYTAGMLWAPRAKPAGDRAYVDETTRPADGGETAVPERPDAWGNSAPDSRNDP